MNWDDRSQEPGYAYGNEPNDVLVAVAGTIPLGMLLSLEDLREELAGRGVLHAGETERHLHEGRYHVGLAAGVGRTP